MDNEPAFPFLNPYLARSGIVSEGKTIIGPMKGDLYDIDKRLASVMRECFYFVIVDIGTDISAEKFIEVVRVV